MIDCLLFLDKMIGIELHWGGGEIITNNFL